MTVSARREADGDVLDGVRRGCAQVMRRATRVRIDPGRLEALAGELAAEPLPAPVWDTRHHYLGAPADTAAFVLTLDTVNFGSGYFPHLRKRPGLSGYFTIATSLTERFEREGPFTAEELCALDAAACARLAGQDRADPVVAELMGLLACALRDLGVFLLGRYGGRFEGPFEDARGSAARLVSILDAMPFFRDVARYGDLEVPFYKRAQITAADLALALGGRGLGRFDDLDRLTCFADNLVPHVLRLDGVLAYTPGLVRRIETGELLPSGSPEEVEIRAGAVHVVERLAEAVRRRGGRATPAQLDFLLWTRGQDPGRKAHPRHRTRCVYY